jgi:hypothetical protein
VIHRARELLEFARRYGYRRDDLVRLIEQLPGSLLVASAVEILRERPNAALPTLTLASECSIRLFGAGGVLPSLLVESLRALALAGLSRAREGADILRPLLPTASTAAAAGAIEGVATTSVLDRLEESEQLHIVSRCLFIVAFLTRIGGHPPAPELANRCEAFAARLRGGAGAQDDGYAPLHRGEVEWESASIARMLVSGDRGGAEMGLDSEVEAQFTSVGGEDVPKDPEGGTDVACRAAVLAVRVTY